MKCLENIVDCYPRSNASDGIAQPASLFLVLYSSARSDLVSHEALPTMQHDDFFTFLLLNQEHGVNNERSQSIQSVHHSKLTHRKDRSARKKKEKRVFLMQSFFLSSLTAISNSKFDHPILGQILQLYMNLSKDGKDIVYMPCGH